MAFYLRKALTLGPLRLNLSRSGLGLSAGIRGARLGVGPRGTYVHMGRGGLYYRQNIKPSTQSPPSDPTPSPTARLEPPGTQPHFEEIESGEVSNMTDESSAQLLSELNRVNNRTELTPLATALAAFSLLILLFVGLHWWIVVPAFLAATWLILHARHLDVTNGTIILTYELEGSARERFEVLVRAFREMCACHAVWHVEAAAETRDLKRHAGASQVVRRGRVVPRLGRPRRIVCNLEVPVLPAGRQQLFFFPDRLLVYDRTRVGAIPYAHVHVDPSSSRFVEDGSVPADAKVVDHTWRYVNKKGGPDRRFRDNPQLPVALYGELHLTSPSGLNELFQCSRTEPISSLAGAISKIGGATPSAG